MSETTIDLDALFDAATLFDLNFELPCDGVPSERPEPCDHAAKWEALFDCGCTRLWCDFHKEDAMDFQADYSYIKCATCLTQRKWAITRIHYVGPLKPV